MTINPRIPTLPERSTSAFYRPGSRHCLDRERSAVTCWASRTKGTSCICYSEPPVRRTLRMDDSFERILFLFWCGHLQRQQWVYYVTASWAPQPAVVHTLRDTIIPRGWSQRFSAPHERERARRRQNKTRPSSHDMAVCGNISTVRNAQRSGRVGWDWFLLLRLSVTCGLLNLS